MSNPFSKLGQILYRAEVGGPQKAVCAESCSDVLSFVPKLSCSLKKKKLFSCSDFFIYFLLLESPLIYRFPPQMSPRGSLLRNLHYSQKLEIVAGPHQNLKWAAGWTSLS